MERKVMNLSGIFWANDYLQGRKPLPIRKSKEDLGFDKLLKNEMEKLDERQCYKSMH